jgi:hypothetical protein
MRSVLLLNQAAGQPFSNIALRDNNFLNSAYGQLTYAYCQAGIVKNTVRLMILTDWAFRTLVPVAHQPLEFTIL